MLLKVCSLLPLLLLVVSCRETGTSADLDFGTIKVTTDSTDSGSIYIIDYVGKEWDVTHAVNEYGFDPELFRHGLGPLAIRPILEPRFVMPGDPDYPSIDNSDRVIGTVINDIVRAYPLAILVNHEIVDEKFGPTYVAVGYWPLVNLTAVYSRETRGGHILTLSASGWTYNNTFVLYDYETESLWYHMPGEDGLRCINGYYADDHLEEFESTQARWSDWKNLYPKTWVLTK